MKKGLVMLYLIAAGCGCITVGYLASRHAGVIGLVAIAHLMITAATLLEVATGDLS